MAYVAFSEINLFTSFAIFFSCQIASLFLIKFEELLVEYIYKKIDVYFFVISLTLFLNPALPDGFGKWMSSVQSF